MYTMFLSPQYCILLHMSGVGLGFQTLSVCLITFCYSNCHLVLYCYLFWHYLLWVILSGTNLTLLIFSLQGEKLLGSLGGIFSKTWKPARTRPIKGPAMTRGYIRDISPLFFSGFWCEVEDRGSESRLAFCIRV